MFGAFVNVEDVMRKLGEDKVLPGSSMITPTGYTDEDMR